MPSSTPTKCRGPVVRQSSLQNQNLSESFIGYHKLKKQLSENDGKKLDAVEVTGQRWSGIERSNSMIRIGFDEERIMGQTKGGGGGGGRPKPAKLAWAEKKQECFDSLLNVEIVATKCQGQPRPLSVKAQRFQTPLIGNKDSLAYTRLQLAERLRNAWSEREKLKPNINIFLAHASDITRNDNQSSDGQDNAFTLSDTLEKKPRPLQVRAFSQDYTPSNIFQDKINLPSFVANENSQLGLNEIEAGEKKGESQANNLVSNNDSPCLRELNKIEIRVGRSDEKDAVDFFENKENIDGEPNSDSFRKNISSEPIVPVAMTAKDRRACFRKSSILQKAITESFSLPTDDEENFRREEEAKPGKSPPEKKSLFRTLSAPSREEKHEKPSIPQKTVKFLPPKRLQKVITFDASDVSQENSMAVRERVKSAPIRRKLKSAAARRKNKEKEDSSSDEDAKETKGKGKTKNGHSKGGSDIVTMVSLVSPAESDTEDSVINLPMESVPSECNEKKELVKEAVMTAGQPTAKGIAFDVQKFVSLRKTKTASFPSRRAPAGTPIIIPSPVISNPALTPAQLQERDRRPPTVFGSSDGRGIKRRLIRSPSVPAKEGDACEEDKPKSLAASLVYENEYESNASEVPEKEKLEEPEDGEPKFKCPKEKECWALYKKMVSNGVSVTFDTVLRGMLTPTEYRLKKNRLLSAC